jgi:hypothetical protein
MPRLASPAAAAGLTVGVITLTAAAVFAAGDILGAAVSVVLVATLILSYGARHRARARLLYNRDTGQAPAPGSAPSDPTERRRAAG